MKRHQSNKKSISVQLVKALVTVLSVATALLLGIIAPYSIVSSSKMVKNEAQIIAQEKGSLVSTLLSKAVLQVIATAKTFSSGNGNDQVSWSFASRTMNEFLDAEPTFYAAYTYWTSGTFQGSLGSD